MRHLCFLKQLLDGLKERVTLHHPRVEDIDRTMTAETEIASAPAVITKRRCAVIMQWTTGDMPVLVVLLEGKDFGDHVCLTVAKLLFRFLNGFF